MRGISSGSGHRTRLLAGGKGGRTPLLLVTFALSFILATSQLPIAAASSSDNAPARAQSTVPISQSLSLRLSEYQGFEVDSFSANTTVQYVVSSNAPVSTALMTAAQYDLWQNDQSDPISNSVTYHNGTSVQNSASIAPGQYFLVFYAYYSRVLIQFGYQVTPNTPYSFGAINPPLAMGIASLGIYNDSGVVTPYEIQTSEIAGFANISSVQVYTQDAYRYGVSTSGFTVQLNAMLVLNDGGASPKVYWVQNVPDFVTAASVVSFADEIWNNTDAGGFMSNQTVTSTNFNNGGFVFSGGTGRYSSSPNYYSYFMNYVTYGMPFDFGLVMKETLVSGTGVTVQLGYRLFSNASAVNAPTVWFDTVTIHDPSVQSAYFEVSGKDTPPTGLYYDAEFVFAGEGNFESAYFTQLNASMSMFYLSGNQLRSFPTYYGFSGSTGEAASNLMEAYSNGVVHLVPGSNTAYPYLGNATLTLDKGVVEAGGSSTTTTTGGTGPTSSQTTSGVLGNAWTEWYVLVGAVVVVVAVAAVAFIRRRPAGGTPPQETPSPPPTDIGGGPDQPGQAPGQ